MTYRMIEDNKVVVIKVNNSHLIIIRGRGLESSAISLETNNVAKLLEKIRQLYGKTYASTLKSYRKSRVRSIKKLRPRAFFLVSQPSLDIYI